MVAVLAVAMVVTEAATWVGAESGCVAEADCYCEAFRADGFAAQPVNTASNLGFVLVGLAVLWTIGKRSAADELLAVSYGVVAVGLGIGSALFHGTITDWGGWADLVSMYTFISLYIAINIGEWRQLAASTTLALFAIAAGALAVVQVPLDQGAGKYLFGGLVAVALATELRVGGRDKRWLIAAMTMFGGSFVIWNLSRTGAAWCDPNSLLQGHAAWHLGSAATVWLLFRYLEPTLVKR